jgi:hypothetical protein
MNVGKVAAYPSGECTIADTACFDVVAELCLVSLSIFWWNMRPFNSGVIELYKHIVNFEIFSWFRAMVIFFHVLHIQFVYYF